MKVLRARLEQLPIPCCSAAKMQAVSDMARAVSAGDLDKKKLDLEIAGLFGLSDEEFKAISHDC